MNSKFKPFQKVLVRDNEENAWECAFYSHYIKEPDIPSHHHVCVGGEDWIYCIPYEGNEKLLNTNKSPESTLEFKFGDKVMVRNSRYDEWQKAIFIRDYIPDGDPKQCYQVTVLRENHLNSYSNFFIVKKGWDNE